MRCAQAALEASRRYNKTQKAKEVRRRYRQSKKGKEWYKAYNKSPEKLREIHKRLARLHNVTGVFTVEEWNKKVVACQGICPRCCVDMDKPTVDHIIPLSKGGTNHAYNIQPLCGRCNSKKGASEIIEYQLVLD